MGGSPGNRCHGGHNSAQPVSSPADAQARSAGEGMRISGGVHPVVLGTRLGVTAADTVQGGEWGMMAGLNGDSAEAVPSDVAVGSSCGSGGNLPISSSARLCA